MIALLRWTEYQFLVVEYSLEIYGALIAATFAVLGIWLRLKLTAKRQTLLGLAERHHSDQSKTHDAKSVAVPTRRYVGYLVAISHKANVVLLDEQA